MYKKKFYGKTTSKKAKDAYFRVRCKNPKF